MLKKNLLQYIVPETPIKFKLMEDEKQEEKISLVFMLGLNKPHSQLEILKELMGLIQREDLVKEIIESKDQKQIKDILKK